MRVTTMEVMSGDGSWIGSGLIRETRSFAAFYEEEYRAVVGLAFVLTGSRSAAEELAQDAFTVAYRRWSEIGTYDRPEAWVRRVLVNRSRSWGRRKGAELRALARIKNRRDRIEELPDPDHEFWDAVRALPRRQSQAIALHYLEDRPVDEIATILDCSSGTVKTHLHRGRQALAEALGARPSDDDTTDEMRSDLP